MSKISIETLKRVATENAVELRRLAGMSRVRGCANARKSIQRSAHACFAAAEVEMWRAVRDEQPAWMIGRDGRLYGWMRNVTRGVGSFDFTLLAETRA